MCFKESNQHLESPEGSVTESCLSLLFKPREKLLDICPWKGILATLGLLSRYVTQHIVFYCSKRKQVKTHFHWNVKANLSLTKIHA